MQRLDSDRMVKQVWEGKSGGRKKRGRPRLTCDGMMGNIVRERGLGWREAKTLSMDRIRWKKFVYRV